MFVGYHYIFRCLLLAYCVLPSVCVIREFYIAAEDAVWDYAPSGRDLAFNDQSEANKKLQHGEGRIGRIYNKVIYRQYTDSTYTQKIRTPAWQGIVGPVMKGQVGDILVIKFRNFASVGRNFSLHPHGLFYTKEHEGALYLDGDSGMKKLDDGVPPGGSYTYVWNISANFAPTANDDNCIPWVYHSHVDAPKDIDSGLVGLLVVCKPGILLSSGRRSDAAKEFVVYQDVANENRNWFIDQNLGLCGNPTLCRQHKQRGDEEFEKSNLMYHINGYSFGNLPDMDVCEGDKVILYFMSLNAGIHTAQIYGQTFTVKNHRMDTVALHPATFLSAAMTPVNRGRWLIVCRNHEHLHEGMTAFFHVHVCDPEALPDTPPGKIRNYYIAIEEMEWDYKPQGTDLFEGGATNHDAAAGNSHHHMHHVASEPGTLANKYVKALYVEYTDNTFQVEKRRAPEDAHLALLGAPIKAEVGDTIEIILLNKASRPYSIYLHGAAMDKSAEGIVYMKDRDTAGMKGAITLQGGNRVYRFTIPWTAAPTAEDPNCVTYTYHSGVDERRDTNSGLIGPMLVCKPGSLDDKGKQVHVNKEFFVLFNIIDENLSWYIDDNIQRYQRNPQDVKKDDEGFKHGNLMHAINGRVYGNLEALEMCLGDRISWHFIGLGSSHDLHTVALQGNAVAVFGQTIDAKLVTPGTGFTGYMHPDNVGRWALYCHTYHHLMAGMSATYLVEKCAAPQSLAVAPLLTPKCIRRYFIAAVEMDWDYSPSKIDKITGKNLLDPNSEAYLYIRNDSGYVGTVYKKAMYREYTDESFTEEKPRGFKEKHLGLLGPIIKAEVGETIEVVFKNKASQPFSIRPHGVFTDKANEGMKYHDDDPKVADNEVAPGKTYVYQWQVPARAGPGPKEANCIAWSYTSGTNVIRDTYSGLFGPLVTCKRGVLDQYNRRKDGVKREFAIMYYIINENRSWYLRQNMNRFKNGSSDPKVFEESNLKNCINGYLYGNLPGLIMEEGENVAWYVLGLGSEDDFHTVHFHGQTFIHKTSRAHRGDVVEVFPGTYETVEMYTDNPGTWLLHCHVADHVIKGMESVYTILPKGSLKDSDFISSKHLGRPHLVCRGKTITRKKSKNNARVKTPRRSKMTHSKHMANMAPKTLPSVSKNPTRPVTGMMRVGPPKPSVRRTPSMGLIRNVQRIADKISRNIRNGDILGSRGVARHRLMGNNLHRGHIMPGPVRGSRRSTSVDTASPNQASKQDPLVNSN